jgi:hypothetical protein
VEPSPESPGLFGGLTTTATWIASLAIAYVGISACHRCNESIDGRRFIERFVVLFAPLSIWFAVIVSGAMIAAMVPLFVIAMRGEEALVPYESWATEIIVGVYLVLFASFYLVLWRSFVRLGAAIRGRVSL